MEVLGDLLDITELDFLAIEDKGDTLKHNREVGDPITNHIKMILGELGQIKLLQIGNKLDLCPMMRRLANLKVDVSHIIRARHDNFLGAITRGADETSREDICQRRTDPVHSSSNSI